MNDILPEHVIEFQSKLIEFLARGAKTLEITEDKPISIDELRKKWRTRHPGQLTIPEVHQAITRLKARHGQLRGNCVEGYWYNLERTDHSSIDKR